MEGNMLRSFEAQYFVRGCTVNQVPVGNRTGATSRAVRWTLSWQLLWSPLSRNRLKKEKHCIVLLSFNIRSLTEPVLSVLKCEISRFQRKFENKTNLCDRFIVNYFLTYHFLPSHIRIRSRKLCNKAPTYLERKICKIRFYVAILFCTFDLF